MKRVEALLLVGAVATAYWYRADQSQAYICLPIGALIFIFVRPANDPNGRAQSLRFGALCLITWVVASLIMGFKLK